MRPAILYVDLLGVRSRWHSGGLEAAQVAFDALESVLLQALELRGTGGIIGGGIESDAAALVCEDVIPAIELGRDLFRGAFLGPTEDGHARLWLRGAVVPFATPGATREEVSLSGRFPGISKIVYHDSLLEAISVERAGFKGMRLLVSKPLVTQRVRNHFRMYFGKRWFWPFRKLDYSSYPGRIGEGFWDVLWMASTEQLDEFNRCMANRLRWSAQDSEEVIQAAATQIVFNEFNAMTGAMVNRARTRGQPAAS